jgi:trk system potassium uptake protein TrkH
MKIIIIGALLLSLPVASSRGQSTDLLTSLFTSTSAVCVTGLVVVDTGTYWSVFGHIVILLLIQIGGLGFMTMSTFIALLLGKRIGLRERLIIKEALNEFSIQGMVKLMKNILIMTVAVEAVGAVLLSIRFIPVYGFVKGIYFGTFHAVSAFCNAGFDLIGGYRNLTPFVGDAVLNLSIMTLIIIGGLGFAVNLDIFKNRRWKRLSLHSKLVVAITLFLIVAGFIFFYGVEYNNPMTLGALSPTEKILAAFFQSVTCRTAGFYTIPTGELTDASKLMSIILMFIGASPASTGSGVKTTTFAILIIAVLSVIRGREDIQLFKRRIPNHLVFRALAIVIISICIILAVTMVLSLRENFKYIDLQFEAVSAFAPVGLSTGITPYLSSIGKAFIIVTMFIGRLGPLTMAFALARKHKGGKSGIRYPEDKVLVG